MDTFRLIAIRPILFCALAAMLGTAIETEAARLKAAVVWIDAGKGVDSDFAEDLQGALAAKLTSGETYDVIPVAKLNQALIDASFARPKGRVLPALAATAGRIAGADVVVYGECYRAKGERILLTTMLRVSDGREIRSIQSTYSGGDAAFLARVPAHNVKTMLAADAETPAAGAMAAATVQVAELPAAPVAEIRTSTPPTPDAATTAEATTATARTSSFQLPDMSLPDIDWPSVDASGWVDEDSFFGRRIEVGTRMMHFELTDDSSGSFLGTINKLQNVQDATPDRLFVHVKINPLWRIEAVLNDEVTARTRTASGKSDGDVTINGPIVTLQRYFPNDTDFVPYLGAGVGIYHATFEETAHWALGYSNPEQWISRGRPTTPDGDRTRKIETESNLSPVIQGGCSWYFAKHWAADLQARFVSSKVDATFVSRVHGRRTLVLPGEFPLDHLGFLLGIRYVPGK